MDTLLSTFILALSSNEEENELTAQPANATNATLFYPWTASNLPGMSYDDPFHLYVFNPDKTDCPRCHSNSSAFDIIKPSVTAGRPFKLGLGLGLGLGVPLLILLTGLAIWPCVRRRRRGKVEQGGGDGGGSQSGEPLVGWKGPQTNVSSAERVRPHFGEADPSLAKNEVHGQSVVEMPGRNVPVEAPEEPARVERVELEGDVRC